ncbi:MAG: hypothetical protein WC702_03080 [Patescibacteria group bacterium]|jgi:hypothetical protein
MDQVKPSVLEAGIVKTVAWFSLFDYPLTAFDIWKWLGVKSSFAEVEETLRTSLWLRGRLEAKEGLFVLGGRSAEGIIATHQERFLDAARKFKKLGWAAKYFSFFPFVRAVFACNTLAWHHTAPESDIDLFIVVSPGTIWLTRLLLVTPFRLLGRRPKQTTVDPFCFSFFVTDENLSLKDLLLSEGDPYMAYWLASLVPVFDRDEIQNRLNEKNNWAFNFLPNAFLVPSQPRGRGRSPHQTWRKGVGDFLETLAKRFQQKFLPEPIKNAANLDSRVVVSDSVLKFHLNDRRAHFRDEWKKIYEAYGAS